MSFIKQEMSNGKDCETETDMPEKLIHDICEDMAMLPVLPNPFGCGVYCEGDGIKTRGYLWYLVHEGHFAVTKCDFMFCKDTLVTMPYRSLYIALRLDYARHLPPGKMLAYMEEKGNRMDVVIPEATRVAYTEVLYVPPFYKKHLQTAFTAAGADPVKILRNMGGEHNWSGEMADILSEIHKSTRTGMAAELFYVAKAYELMAALVVMGTDRLPLKDVDYEDILHVIDYIDKNYTKDIKQMELVRISNMSPTKLKNLFRKFTGCTITDYIMGKKSDHAAHLLADSDISIKEIAGVVGFDTATGFATSFKKQMGISPSAYRKQMKIHCLMNVSETKDLSF